MVYELRCPDAPSPQPRAARHRRKLAVEVPCKSIRCSHGRRLERLARRLGGGCDVAAAAAARSDPSSSHHIST